MTTEKTGLPDTRKKSEELILEISAFLENSKKSRNAAKDITMFLGRIQDDIRTLPKEFEELENQNEELTEKVAELERYDAKWVQNETMRAVRELVDETPDLSLRTRLERLIEVIGYHHDYLDPSEIRIKM